MSMNFTETFRIGIIIFLFLGCINKANGVGFYNPVYIRIPASLSIEEKLEAICWDSAKKISGFARTNGEKANQQTAVAVCYDKENLFFIIECFEKNMKQLKSTVTEKHGQVWEDDSIEIFIAPDPLHKNSYYQFAANSLGTMYARGINSKTSMDMPWDVHAEIKPSSWVLKIAIPFLSMGLSPAQEKKLFLLSVCRGRKTGETEYSVWPAGGWFHKPHGHLLFSTYDDYLKKEVFPEWLDKKRQAGKILSSDIKIDQKKKMQDIINSVETEIKKIQRKRGVAAEIMNEFFAHLEKNYKNMALLTEDIKFTIFLNMLKLKIQP